MQNNTDLNIREVLRRARRARLLRRMLAGFSMLVIIVTMSQLRLFADALSTGCDQKEHTHSQACFDSETGELSCGLEEHVHTDACRQTRPVEEDAPAEELTTMDTSFDEAESVAETQTAEATELPNYKYTMGKKTPVYLSEVAKKLKLELDGTLKLRQLEDEAHKGECIKIVDEDEDFAIYPLCAFDEALLEIRCDGATYVVILLDAEEPAAEETLTPETAKPETMDLPEATENQESLTEFEALVEETMPELAFSAEPESRETVKPLEGKPLEGSEVRESTATPELAKEGQHEATGTPKPQEMLPNEESRVIAETPRQEPAEVSLVSNEPEKAISEDSSIGIHDAEKPINTPTPVAAEKADEPDATGIEQTAEVTANDISDADDVPEKTEMPISTEVPEAMDVLEEIPVQDENEQPDASVEQVTIATSEQTEVSKITDIPETTIAAEPEETTVPEATPLVFHVDLAGYQQPFSLRVLVGDWFSNADFSTWVFEWDETTLGLDRVEDEILLTPLVDFEETTLFVDTGVERFTLVLERSALSEPARYSARFDLSQIDLPLSLESMLAEAGSESIVRETEEIEKWDIEFDEALIRMDEGNMLMPIADFEETVVIVASEEAVYELTLLNGAAPMVKDCIETGLAMIRPVDEAMGFEETASADVAILEDGEAKQAWAQVEAWMNAAKLSSKKQQAKKAEQPESSASETSGSICYQVVNIELNHVNEEEYPDGFEVEVSLPERALGKDFALYHIHENEDGTRTIRAIPSDEFDVYGDTLNGGYASVTSFRFVTKQFSSFVLAYTVDFEYNGYTYSMPGGTWVWLSDVLEELHTDFSVNDLTDVSFTDESLIAVEYVIGTEPESEGLFDWRLTSLLPFQSHELLTMTDANGQVYIINVTDDGVANNYHKDMNALLVPGTLKIYVDGEEVPEGDTVYVRDGMLYDLSFQLKEAGINQFYNQNEENPDHLYFQLPDGFVLPEDYRDTMVINLGLDGKVYGNILSYDKENNRLLLDWNKADRKYQRLIAAGNLRFTLHLSGYITPGEVKYSGEKLFTAVRYDPHNASVAKTGSLDASDLEHQVITYTVKVMSDGSTENLTLTDVLGSALSYAMKDGVPDVTWSRESTMSTMQTERRVETSQVGSETVQDAPYIRNTAEGFLITIPETHDGDVLTFTYKANVDYTKIATSGSATIDEMGNTVQIYGDSDPTDNKAVYHEKEVFFSDIAKDTDGPGPRYKENDREYQNIPWSIVTNAAKVISFHGTQITDRLTEYNGNGDSEIDGVPVVYTGAGITIHVYAWDEQKLNRVFVETRNVPWSKLHISDDMSAKDGWTYAVPDTDGAYEYDISYLTKADVTGLENDVMLRNDAHSLGGNDRATTLLHPKGTGLSIKKRVISYNDKEVTWEIIVALDDIADGYNDVLILTDCLPNKYDKMFAPNSPRRDTYKDGSLKIYGLQSGETYDVFYSEFKKSKTSNEPGDGGSAYLDWNARNAHQYPKGSKDENGNWEAQNVGGGSNLLFVRFYQDGVDGLKAPADGSDSRSLRVQLTTYNNPDWLKDMQSHKGIRGDYLLKHQNDAYINTAHELAEVMITGKQLFKKCEGKVTWGWSELNGLTGEDAFGFWFETYLGGVYPGEKIVIDDYFDTSLYRLVYRPSSSPKFRAGNAPHYADNVTWNLSNGDEYGTVLTQTDYGFHVEINNPPTQPDGSMYGAYGLDYVLIPKDADALNEIQRQVLEAGGIKNYINTATSGELTDSDTFDVELLVRFKPVSKNIPTTEDVKNNMVEYTITLNPQKMMMNEGDPMTMEDTFENLSIDYASIKVVTDPEGREQEVSYDFSGNTGYYTVPDETKVIITYKARISPPEGTQWTQDGDTQVAEVEVTNVASMLTWQDGGTNTLEVRRDAGADIYRIRAFKYGSGHMEDGLNGAVFGLYQDKMDDSGNPVQQKDENGAPVVDSWGNSVYEKEAISRTKGSLAGSPITFATRDVWMLDGLIQSELTGMSAESVSSLTDDELLKKLLGNYDEFNIADARAELRNLSGYADVQLSDDADGVHLQQGKTYYLKELTEPTGYAKDTSVEYYAFRFGEDAMYVNGVWQYYNSDILKIRNSPTDGAFTLRKKLEGNYALSDEQKDALRFAVYKLVGSSWERVEVEVPATDGTGNTTYKKVAELTYDQLRDGLSVTHIGAGTFRIIESMAARGEDVPGSVSHTVSFTRDGIEDDMTEDGGKQYAQFEITDDDILNGLEHTFEITNIYTQETVTFNTRKAWSDAEGNPVTPSGAKVTFGVFSLTDGALSETALPVQTVTLDGIPDVNTAAVSGESAAWIAQFARLPKLDDAGIEITYVVKEISGITGYEAIYGNEDGYLSFKDGENVIVPIITNKQETVEYTVNKQWTKPFWENESWTAPSGVKLGVYYGTTETEAYAKYTSGQRAYREITLPAEGADPEAAWEANFTDLPKSDGTGKEYQWIAVETVCPVGFVAEYPNGGDYLSLTGNSDEALTVMNRVEGVDVSFTKAWQRTLNNEWPEGQSIEVTLTRTLKGGDEASDDAFTAVYTIIRSGDELSATLTTGKAPTDWNNNEVTPVISVDGKTGRASFILKGLPRYGTVDGNNGEWEYRFAESELSDYATTYSTGASYAYALNGGVITNTQKDAEISFKKTWIGEDGQSESWAEGTTITVRRIQQFKYLDGVEEKTETIGTIEFKIEKTSDGFNIEPSEGLVFDEEKVRFTSGTYPKYGVRSGHTGEYIFTWEETAVTDSNGDELSYVPVVNMDAADSGQTNIVNIKLKTVDAKVDKTWLDGENSVPDALKAPVRVRLYHKVDAPADGDDYIEVNSSRYVPVIQDAMGVAIDAIELSADNGWTATVPLLSKYVSNGADAAEEVYIFREEAVYLDGAWTNDVEAYYTVENTDTETAPYGTVINNKPKDTLTKTSVFVSKTWADSGDHSQDEVTVRLYQAIDIPADADVMNINVRTEWYYVDSNGELIPAPPLNKSTYSTMTDNVGGHVNFYVNAYKGSPIWGLYLIDSSNLFDSYGNTQVGGKIIVIEDPDLIEFTKGETSVTGADDITLRASLSSNWEKYISIPEETKASWPYYKIGQTSGVYNYRFIVKYKEEAPERKSADTLRLLSPDEGIASIPDNAVQTDSVLVLKNGSWSGSFNDLPTTIGGYPVTYYVVEETVKTKAAAVSVAYAHNGNAWTITNTAEYNEPTTDFEFTKVWYDNDGKEVDWQDNISVSLFSSTVEGEDTKIATFNLSSDGGTSGAFTWSAEKIQNDAQKINRTKFKIEGLPAKADGATLTYYVTEAKIEGYKDPVYGTSAGTENNVITLKTDAKAESGQYIQNIPEDAYVLPSTGGIGSGAYRILGTFMTLYAALLLARRRKKRNGE